MERHLRSDFKGQGIQNTMKFSLKVFDERHILMQTEWKSDSWF